MVSLVRSLAELVFGLLVVAVVVYAALLGWYGVACPRDGAGWALFTLLLFPVASPPLGLGLFAVGAAASVLGRPFRSGHRRSWLTRAPVAALAVGVAAWAIAAATDAHARCSVGF